jgi:hypothetical protein
MSTELAKNYANSVTADIQRKTEAGAPFGWTHPDTGEWSSDMPDVWETDEDCEWQETSAMDYLSDVLDFEYRVNESGEYRSGKILIHSARLDAWIDTGVGRLIVTWWNGEETRGLPKAFIDDLDDALRELWESR